MAVWVVVFVLAFGELGASILVAPPGETTLPIRIYTLIANAPPSQVAALALVQAAGDPLTAPAPGVGHRGRGPAMNPPLLRLAGVTKHYRDHAALTDVSIGVSASESVVILGPSGCGKTTLLRVVAGLTRPDSGEIRLDGRVVSAAGTFVPPHGRRLGFVFQDLALWPHLTVRKNLEFVMRAVGVPKSEREDRARQTLSLVQIAQLSARYPHELSGGEQQRAALARALVGQARLLLLDEPLSSLDADLRQILRIELRQLQRSLGLTTIYVTHDREDAAVLGDRVIEMRAGRITSARPANSRQERS